MKKTTYTARVKAITADGATVNVTVYSAYKTIEEAQEGINRFAEHHPVISSEIIKN